jgi:hypothetical protein
MAVLWLKTGDHKKIIEERSSKATGIVGTREDCRIGGACGEIPAVVRVSQ